MKSTLEIIIACEENAPVTERELRLALLALSSIERFVEHELDACIDALEEDKPLVLRKLRASLARDLRERMFQARKREPESWLGRRCGRSSQSAERDRNRATERSTTMRYLSLRVHPLHPLQPRTVLSTGGDRDAELLRVIDTPPLRWGDSAGAAPPKLDLVCVVPRADYDLVIFKERE